MDNQLENTSLAEGIKSKEAAPVIIDKEIPYVPIEELFNTSEYDAYIDTMDVAQLQQLEASTADIDKYGIAAMANLGVSRPTIAADTYDPVLQQVPPTADVPDSFVRSMEESLGQGLQDIYAPKAPGETLVQPIVSSMRQTNFMRYYNHPEYSRLGFSPYANNEEYYNSNSTAADDRTRMWGQFWGLVGTGFKSSYRSIGDMLDGNMLAPDLSSADEFEDAMAIGNSSRGTWGASANNLLLNSGYTFGIISSIAMEEVVLAAGSYASGGLLAGPAGVKTVANAGKLARIPGTIMDSFALTRGIKSATQYTRSMISQMRNAEKAKEFFTAANSGKQFVGKIFFPETTAAIRNIKTAQQGAANLSNLAKTSQKFGGFYRDVRSLNFALSESKLEAGLVYNERIRDNLQIQLKKNYGSEVTAEQMDVIVKNASSASMNTLLRNAPIIFLTNQLVLGNAFGGFSKSFARMANENLSAAGRRIMKSSNTLGKTGKPLKDVYSKGRKGLKGLADSAKNASVKGGARALAGASLRYFSANLGEGFQEVTQEAISSGVNHYFSSIMKDPLAGGVVLHQESVSSGIGEQFSSQGFEVFMSGFLMGGIVQGPQKLFFQGLPYVFNQAKTKWGTQEMKDDIAEQNKAEENYVDAVLKAHDEGWNNEADNPGYMFNFDNLNFHTQKNAKGELTHAAYTQDLFGFIDVQDEAKFQQIFTVLSTTGAQTYINQITDYQNMSDEAMAEAWPERAKDIKNGKLRKEFANSLIQINKTEEGYIKFKNKYPNRFNPDQYDRKSRLWNEEALKQRAWQHGAFLYMFTNDGFERAQERYTSIQTGLASDPLFKNMAASDITVLLDPASMMQEIKLLEKYVLNLALDKSENKQEIKEKKAKIKNLKAFLNIATDKKNLTQKGVFKRNKKNKLRSAFNEYVKTLANEEGTFANQEVIDDALEKIVDYGALKGRAKTYYKAIEYLNNPKRFDEIVDRSIAFLKVDFINNKKNFESIIRDYLETNKKNQLLNSIASLDIYPDIYIMSESGTKINIVEEFLSTGNPEILTKLATYSNELGDVSNASQPLEYKKVMNLIAAYTAQRNEKRKKTETTKTESEVNKENREEINTLLKDMGVEEDILFSDSSVYKERERKAYEKYSILQTDSGKAPLTLKKWIDSEKGVNFRKAYNALRSIWISNDKLINQDTPQLSLTDAQILNDTKFINWLISPEGKANDLVETTLIKLEVLRSDITGQIEEIGGDGSLVDSKEVVGNPGKNYTVVVEMTQNSSGNEAPLYSLINSETKEDISLELLGQYSFNQDGTPNNINGFLDKKEAVDLMLILEQELSDTTDFVFDGIDLKYGMLVYGRDKKTNKIIEYVVLSKKNKILEGGSLILLPTDKAYLNFNDRREFLVPIKQGKFKNAFTLQNLEITEQPENVSRLNVNEPIRPYPYRNIKSKETNAVALSRYKAILSALSVEEANNLELVVRHDNPISTGKYKYIPNPESEQNKHINKIRSKFEIGIRLGGKDNEKNTETLNKVNEVLKNKGLAQADSEDGVFAFINVGGFSFEDNNGNIIHPSNLTEEQLSSLIYFPEFQKELTKGQALELVKRNFAANQALSDVLDKRMANVEVGKSAIIPINSLSDGVSFDMVLGKTGYPKGEPLKRLDELEYQFADGKSAHLIYKLEKLSDSKERDPVPITNLQGAARTKLIKDVKAGLKAQGLWNDLLTGTNAQVAIVLLPNGQYNLVTLKPRIFNTDFLFTEIITKAQKVLEQQPEGDIGLIKGSKESQELYDFKNTVLQQFYIATTGKNNYNIKLDINPWGKIELQLFEGKGKDSKKVKGGGSTINKKIILDDKLENSDKIKQLFDAFNAIQEKLGTGEKITNESFRISYPRATPINELIQETTTSVMPSIAYPGNISLSVNSSLRQAVTNVEEISTSGTFTPTERFTDAEGVAIPTGQKITTEGTINSEVGIPEKVQKALDWWNQLSPMQKNLPQFTNDNNYRILQQAIKDDILEYGQYEYRGDEVLEPRLKSQPVSEVEAEITKSSLEILNDEIVRLKAFLQLGKKGKEKTRALKNSEYYQSLLKRRQDESGLANKIVQAVTPKDVEDINTFIDWASLNLPDSISIQDIALLGNNLKAGGLRVGAFALDLNDIAGGVDIKGTIYTGASSPYRYHEAFHGVFRMLLSNEEISKYLSIARKEVRAKLRSEGKNFNQELERFRNSADTYTNMSAAKLEKEYYEEYLADEFEKFKINAKNSNTSSEVKSLFTRLLDWIKSVFGSYSSKELLTLFENIDAGKYRSSSIVTNQFTDVVETGGMIIANALIPYATINDPATINNVLIADEDRRKGMLYLDSAIADPLIAGIAAMYLQRVSNNTDPLILRSTILEDTIEDFEILYDPAEDRNLDKSEEQKILLNQAWLAITEYKSEIEKQVYAYLNIIDSQVEEEEYNKEYFEDTVGIRNTDQWNMDGSMIGGLNSTPKMIRAYLAGTTISRSDFFSNEFLTDDVKYQIKNDKGEFVQEKIITPVNFAEVYNGLLKSVKNIESPKLMLQNMYFFGQQNPETGAVVSRFLADIGVAEETLLNDSPLPLEMTDPFLFNSFTKSFENFRVDYLFFQRERSGTVLMYSAAQRDDINSQIDRWSQAWTQADKKLKSDENIKEELEDLLDEFQAALAFGQLQTEEKVDYDAKITEESQRYSEKLFELTGVKLSTQFIAFSLISNIYPKNRTPKQNAFLNVHKQEEAILQEDMSEMKTLIRSGSDIFSPGDSGMNSRLIRLAINNAPFDETIGLSVFKNAEGNLVYAHQKPTFHLKEVERLNSVEYIEDLKESKPYLKNNHLLNNPAFVQMSNDSRHKIVRIAGSAVGTINETEEDINANISGVSSRQTYGNFTPQEFALTLINSYTSEVNTKSGKVAFVETIDGNGKTIKTALSPSLLRVLEASNTGDLMGLPVTKAVERLGKGDSITLTPEIVDVFTTSIITEFDRIRLESSIKDDPNRRQIVGFNILDSDRGYKLHNSSTLLDSTIKEQLEVIANKNDLTFDEALVKIGITPEQFKDNLIDILNSQYDDFKKILTELNIDEEISTRVKYGLEDSSKYNKNLDESSRLLNFESGPLAEDFNLRQIFFNDWVNTKSINEILLGDQAVSLKNAIDAVKRAKGRNAATISAYSAIIAPSYGINHVNDKISAFIIEEPQGISSITDKPIDKADAQLYYTTKGFKYSEFGFGHLTPMQVSLLDEIENDGQRFVDPLKYQDPAVFNSRKKMSSEEIFGENGYVANGLMLNSRKLQYFDGEVFIKMSAIVLIPQFTSNNIETNPLNPPIWVAKPNRIILHNLRVKMETEESENDVIAIAAPMTAFKMLKQDITSLSELENSNPFAKKATELSAKNLGLQVANPSNKMETIDPTQIKNLVTSEQTDDAEVPALRNKDGSPMNIGQIRTAYNLATSRRVMLKYRNKRDLVFEFEASNESLLNELKISQSTGELTANLLVFLKFAQSALKSSQSSSNLMEFFSDKNGQQHYNLNNPITINKFESLFLNFLSKGVLAEKAPGHSLTLVSDFGNTLYRRVYEFDENGLPYRSEVIRQNVWERSSGKNSYTNNNIINSTQNEGEPNWKGIKVPEGGVVIKDRLRMGVMEFDSNNEPTGQRHHEGIMPAHFAEIMDLIENTNQPLPDVVAKMFAIRIPSQDNHSTMSSKIVDFMPAIYGSIGMFSQELIEISGADFDVDKVYAAIKEWYVKNKKFVEYGKATKEGAYKDYIRYINSKVNKKDSIYNEALILPAAKIEDSINDAELKAVKKAGLTSNSLKALQNLGLPITYAAYVAYKEKNGEPYAAPLNNEILDYKYALMGNNAVTTKIEGKPAISYSPASLEILEDIWEWLEETSPYLKERSSENNLDVDNLLGKVKAFTANKGASIGTAVSPNSSLSLLSEYDISLENDGPIIKFNGITFNTYSYDRERLVDGRKGRRKQDISSSLITMVTDNPTERLVGKLGLNKEALALTINLTALSVPIHTSILLINIPEIHNIYNKAVNKKEKYDKGVTRLVADRLEELKNYFQQDGTIDITKEEVSVTDALLEKYLDVSIPDLSIVNKEYSQEEKDAEFNYNKDLYFILNAFSEGTKVAKYTSNMRAFSDLTSSLGRDISAVNSKKQKMDVLFAKNAMMDLSPIYKSDTWQSTYATIFNEVYDEVLPATFLSASQRFKNLMNNVLINVNTDSNEFSTDVEAKIARDLLSYITIKAYQHNNNNGIADLDNNFLYPSDESSINVVISDLLETNVAKNNFFLQVFAQLTPATQRDNFTGMNLLLSNSYRSLDSQSKIDLQSSFAELYGNLETRSAAEAVIHYIMVKDGLQLTYGTLLDAISPFTMAPYLDHIATANNALREGSDEKMMAAFGLTFDEMEKEFVTGYFSSNVTNALLLSFKKHERRPLPEGVTVNENVLTINYEKSNYLKDRTIVRVETSSLTSNYTIYTSYMRDDLITDEVVTELEKGKPYEVKTTDKKGVYIEYKPLGSNQQWGGGFMFGPRMTYVDNRLSIPILHADQVDDSYQAPETDVNNALANTLRLAETLTVVSKTASEGGTTLKITGNISEEGISNEDLLSNSVDASAALLNLGISTATPTLPTNEATIKRNLVEIETSINQFEAEVQKLFNSPTIELYENAINNYEFDLSAELGSETRKSIEGKLRDVKKSFTIVQPTQPASKVEADTAIPSTLPIAEQVEAQQKIVDTMQRELDNAEVATDDEVLAQIQEVYDNAVEKLASLDNLSRGPSVEERIDNQQTAQLALDFEETNPQLQNYWDNEIENDPVKKAIFAKNNMGTYLNMKAVYDDQVKKGMYLATSSTTSEEEFMEFNKCLN